MPSLFRTVALMLLLPHSLCLHMYPMLRTRPLALPKGNDSATGMQFAHLHHMKTGGTSFNDYIRCSVERLNDYGKDVTFGSVTECAPGMINSCLNRQKKEEDACQMRSATAMNFCTSLANVQKFGWGKSDKVTILRDAVDRVWSMYRFRVQGCYNCMPLAEVYHRVCQMMPSRLPLSTPTRRSCAPM